MRFAVVLALWLPTAGLLAVEVSPPSAVAPPAVPPTVYDPLHGLEASGRVPRVEPPAELANPERWRYIPPGRIKPGSVIDRLLVTSFVVPILFFEEDVGFGAGIGFTDLDFRASRRQEFLGAWASLTSEGQQKYRLLWVRHLGHHQMPDGGVFFAERNRLQVDVGYDKPLTTRFFGLGPKTEADDETSYTNEATHAAVGLERGVPDLGAAWVARLGLRFEHHSLHPGAVDGRPSLEEVFPDLAAAGDGHDSLWLQAGLSYDCRDSAHQPYRGWTLGIDVATSLAQTDGAAGTVTTLHGSFIQPLPSPFHDGGDADEANPPTDTFALGGFVAASGGRLPFYFLPSLGGENTQRGFIQNRWTGRAAWHLSAEWRTWPVERGYAFTDSIRIERFGLALFYDLGAVAAHADELKDSPLIHSYGLGLRLAFERTAIFRLDFGFSEEGTAFNADFGLSF